MSVDTSWDIDNYRSRFEPADHWKLKKEFLMAHKSHIAEERLVCLAQVYINTKLMGCRYPAAVTAQVLDLAAALTAQRPGGWIKRLPSAVVRASSDSASAAADEILSGSSPAGNSSSRPVFMPECRTGSLLSGLKDRPAGVVDTSHGKGDGAHTVSKWSESLGSFSLKNVQPNLDKPLQSDLMHLSLASAAGPGGKCEDSQVNEEIISEMEYDCFKSNDELQLVNFPKSVLKQSSSVDAPGSANIVIDKEGICSSSVKENSILTSEPPITKIQRDYQCPPPDDVAQVMKLVIKSWSSSNPLERILLIHRRFLDRNQQRPTSILTYSAQFNKMVFKIKPIPSIQRWEAYVNDQVVDSLDNFKGCADDAKGVLALRLLKKMCKTNCLMVVNKLHSDRDCISTAEVSAEYKMSGEDPVAGPAVSDESVGSKMLKSMGWTGGGLGRQGQGIEDPIQAAAMLGRTGIGYQSQYAENIGEVTSEFELKVHQLITKFCREVKQGISDHDDLVFANKFSKDQRAFIHEIAPLYDLKHCSYGEGNKRYLVLTPKLTMRQQLMAILNRDGESEKFSLYRPGSYDVRIFTTT